ncbi:MAG: Ldh family oxidoreductase [Deltaproteobacteria bacterium]|nr:Ldh family oxidoreductase [Deltaproteobacteria bacterium]
MKVQADRLKEIAIRVLKGLHAADDEAAVVADALIQAELRGIDTHGVHLLTLLPERVAAGMLQIPTKLTVLRESGATALLDGGNGLGPVAAHRAMEISIGKAKEFGIGCCPVRNTNNIGMLSVYTLMAARENTVGIVMANAAAAMSPWGGAEAFFGTNPLSISVPGAAGAPPVVLDMSSTVVARGKIRRADRLNESIPAGWAFDETGMPTTDPAAALKGTLMPIGGPKGYGLALMIDVLAGLLSGSKYGPEIRTFHQLEGPTGAGVFTLAIEIERFMPLGQFTALFRDYLASIKAVRKAKGISRIYWPGEIEYEKEQQGLSEGIEVSPASAGKLNALLEEFGSPLRLA